MQHATMMLAGRWYDPSLSISYGSREAVTLFVIQSLRAQLVIVENIDLSQVSTQVVTGHISQERSYTLAGLPCNDDGQSL